MPRVGRVVLSDYPHHIVQRGRNRQVVFAADSDFGYYLETLSQWRGVYGVRNKNRDRSIFWEIECIDAINKSVPFFFPH